MSLNERQNNISNLHSSSSYDPSYNVKTNTFNDTKNGTPNQKKPKE